MEVIAEDLRDPLVETLTEQAEKLVKINERLRKDVRMMKTLNLDLRKELARIKRESHPKGEEG